MRKKLFIFSCIVIAYFLFVAWLRSPKIWNYIKTERAKIVETPRIELEKNNSLHAEPNNRFRVIHKEWSGVMVWIILDTRTERQYLFTKYGEGAGLCELIPGERRFGE